MESDVVAVDRSDDVLEQAGLLVNAALRGALRRSSQPPLITAGQRSLPTRTSGARLEGPIMSRFSREMPEALPDASPGKRRMAVLTPHPPRQQNGGRAGVIDPADSRIHRQRRVPPDRAEAT